jgi:hypothetical protein
MAKVASKTNPGRQKGSSKATKMYKGKPVQPFKFICRHSKSKNMSYMAAEYENGEVVENVNDGMPVRWDSI